MPLLSSRRWCPICARIIWSCRAVRRLTMLLRLTVGLTVLWLLLMWLLIVWGTIAGL